ncbi:sensor histidine kinase [Deinococcus aestuarii]|uniref:sensor histidine kinase n=1 Tax=Deinococcus aestuarii TaxID=2774531 RepID=UPI001FE7E7F0|nr:ATP-binding protein [Deinococcus aestuarii]
MTRTPHPVPDPRSLADQRDEVQRPQEQGPQRSTFFMEAPVAAFALDAEGRVQDVNRRGLALVGLARETLLGRPFSELVAPTSRPIFEALLGRVFDAPVGQSAEIVLPRPDGTFLDVLLEAVSREGEGLWDGCSLVVTDITAYKAAQRVLQSGNADLSGQLQERTARARALNEELEHVVTTFIQQLQRPTRQAMSVLGLLRKALGDQPEEVNRPLLQIERALQQIVALFESVNRYMQARQLQTRIRPVDLSVVLREVLKDIRDLLRDRDVQLTHDALPVVQGDSQALSVIFTEYLSNALKFTRTREEARIHILVRETETEYHVGVQDNGVGFDPRQEAKLFRLFGRQHSSNTYEGSGLGLAVIRRVCERFGGRAWGEGQPDQGATFWFAWPKRPVVLE